MEYYEEGKKATIVGAIGNIVLSILKISIGTITGSSALIADGIHSFSDLVTDVILLFGLKYAVKPPDKTHAYGHKKFEDIACMAMAGLLVLMGVGIMYRAVGAIYYHNVNEPSISTLICAIFAVVIKEGMFRYTKHIAEKIKSESIMINAWEQRSDSLSSVAVVIGVIIGYLYAPLHILDPIIAFIIGIFIARIGIISGWKPLCRLVDTAPPEYIQDSICSVIRSDERVKDFHKLKTRYSGTSILVDVHIQVDSNVSVEEGHRISGAVKHAIIAEVPDVHDVLVHLEPHVNKK